VGGEASSWNGSPAPIAKPGKAREAEGSSH